MMERLGGRNMTNLWFADDIDPLVEEEQELEDRDQCWEDQADNKQRQWHPEIDQGKRAEAGQRYKF